MAIPVSTIPRAAAYLETATLAAAVADPDAASIAVTVGNPGSVKSNNHIIIAGGETRRQTEPFEIVGSGGPGWLLEKYQLNCVIYAFADDKPVNVMQRAYQLLAYLETAMRTDPSFGDLVLISYPSDQVGGEPEPEEGGGYASLITLTIHVEAQI